MATTSGGIDPAASASSEPLAATAQVPFKGVDPDQQCAVIITWTGKGARCPVKLSCKRHSEEQKAAVVGRSRPYHELLHGQPPNTARFNSVTIAGQPASKFSVIDLNIHCAVPRADGSLCTAVLTCAVHSDAAKELVDGRDYSFQDLLRIHKLNTTKKVGPDTHCSVITQGMRCTCLLDCTLHPYAQKSRVSDRTMPFTLLLNIQKCTRVRISGYSLASAAASAKGAIPNMRRRYRRDGMQHLCTPADEDAEKKTPMDTMLGDPGQNLQRIRHILYEGGTGSVEDDVSRILPRFVVRGLDADNTKIADEEGAYHFCFVKKGTGMKRRSVAQLKDDIHSGRIKESCVISAPHPMYQLSPDAASLILTTLRDWLARYPHDLHIMTDALKELFLHHAIASTDVSKIPHSIDIGEEDGKTCLRTQLLHFDPSSHKNALRTKVALPINCQPRMTDVPHLDRHFLFQGPDLQQLANEPQVPKLQKILSLIVCRLQLKRVSHKQVVCSLSELSSTFGVPLLFRTGKCYQSTGRIAVTFAYARITC